MIFCSFVGKDCCNEAEAAAVVENKVQKNHVHSKLDGCIVPCEFLWKKEKASGEN